MTTLIAPILILSFAAAQGRRALLPDVFESYDKPSVAVFFKCDGGVFMDDIKAFIRQGPYVQFCTDFDNLDLSSSEKMVFVLNLGCRNSRDILSKADDLRLFKFPFRWLILNDDQSDMDATVDLYLANLNLWIDSDVVVGQRLNLTDYKMAKVFKRPNDRMETQDFAAWGPGGLKIGEKIDGFWDRKNLRRASLKTAIVVTHKDTLNHLTDYREKHIDSITKVNYVLLQHLADVVNCSLDFTIKGSWGYKNGSEWTGMIGELIHERADIGGTPMFVTTNRISVVDYVAMTTATKSYFIFRQPKMSYVYNVFLLPFHWTVWLSIGGLLGTVALGLAFVVHWEKHGLPPRDAPFLALAAACQQGAELVPTAPSGRVLTLSLYLAAMFLYTSYSANIVALLQSSANNIRTLPDLLKSRLHVGVDDTVFNRFYFPDASEPVRRALYLEKVAPPGQTPHFYPIEEGVRRIRNGLFAFHMESGAGYKLVGDTFYEHEKCDLSEISFLQVPDPWLALRKNSTYKEVLKTGLRRIHESGLQAREHLRIYTRRPGCAGGRGGSAAFVSVGLVECRPAAVMLAAGMAAALLVLAAETLWSPLKRARTNHQ